MQAGNQANDILDTITADLYRRVAGQEPLINLPIKIIDSPSIAHAIFRQPNLFIKNYGFLESFSKGRFSANGHEWKIRADLTQPFYSRAQQIVSDAEISKIYQRHFQAYANNSSRLKKDIFHSLINAAIEVISTTFKLKQVIPWPAPLIENARELLRSQQAFAWTNASATAFHQNHLALSAVVQELEQLWAPFADLMALLDQWRISASKIENFNPVGELIQNLMATSDTTASVMLWAIDCLARNQHILSDLAGMPHTPEQIEQNRTLFIQELLRLFPPIPFVTRVCQKNTEIEGISFLEGEPIGISMIGIHCNKDYWSEPLSFKHPRQEFVTESYSRMAYVPFLSGPRVCGGMKLATREISLALNALLNQFTITASHEPLTIESGLTLRPNTVLDQYLQAKL